MRLSMATPKGPPADWGVVAFRQAGLRADAPGGAPIHLGTGRRCLSVSTRVARGARTAATVQPGPGHLFQGPFFGNCASETSDPSFTPPSRPGIPSRVGGYGCPGVCGGGEPLPQAFVALREGVPVGTVSLEMGEHPLHAETFCCIVGLYVPPTFRRQGMGA